MDSKLKVGITSVCVQAHLRKALLAISVGILMLMLGISPLFAQEVNATQTVKINSNQSSLSEVLKQIRKQSNIDFIYKESEIKDAGSISLDIEGKLTEVLDQCLQGTKLRYEIVDNIVVIKPESEEPQKPEMRTITGVVKDNSTGATIPGVYVIAQRENKQIKASITDAKGKFNMVIPAEANALTISFVGYKSKLIPLKDEVKFTIALEPEVHEIEDVVVTGIFNKAKESYTGAATFISKTELEDFESRNLLSTISNIDPAFNIVLDEENGSDPNKMPEINIRGTSSVATTTTSTSSQYVTDDFEDLQDNERVNLNTPLFILDGFEISLQRMMDLNQDEIESVTILKDASATAIYGSQGANGVVVLTTVKPKAGKLKINYTGGFNIEVPDLRSYNLMDASGKLALEKEAGLYESDVYAEQLTLKKAYNDKLKTVLEGTDTYWLSKPVQVGLGQSHRLSLTGGDPAFRYGLNFQYRNTQGAMKGSIRDNFNGSVNISYLYENLKFTNILSLGFNQSDNSQYGAFSSYASLNPYWREYDEEGQLLQQLGLGDPIMSAINNPLYNASLGGYDQKRYTNINENFQLEWTVTEALKVSARFGYSKNNSTSDKFTPPNHTDFIGKADNLRGKYVFSTSESSTMNGQFTLSYGKVFAEKHRLFVGLNSSMRESKRVSYGMIVTGFANDKMDFISMGSQYSGTTPYGSEGTTRSIGFTSNLNYTYDNRYYADLSYRLDGASSFGKESRFAPFYSIGVGWNAHRTAFVKDNLQAISQLRLRYSYGVTGSLQFSPYDAMTTYEYLTGDDRYDGNLGTSIKRIGNDQLKWQTTYQHNTGFDMSLWNNKFSIGGNYYYKKTEDLITSVNLPLSNGYVTYTENMGDVLNQGFEVNASVQVLNQTRHRPGVSLRGNIAHNRNKLLKLSDAMKSINQTNEENSSSLAPVYLYREGESMNALYVVPSLGIDPMTGREAFLNADGEMTFDYPKYNKIPVGLMQPKINGRLSSTVSYRNLRMSVGFSFRLGASLYNSTLASKVETTDLTKNVDARVYNDRWKNPGDIAQYKGLTNTSPTYMSTRFVQTERTLSLNTFSLDYMVPRDWLKKNLNISRLNISYATNDLLYFSTIKRERGTNYPFSWRHDISLSIGL
ncbi:MAG: SusC/RagA family TonB-linked outer membrane protein [Mangrovibacterium sp.]